MMAPDTRHKLSRHHWNRDGRLFAMRSITVLLFVLSACEIRQVEPTKNDALLARLESALPAGWTMVVRDDSIAIERREKVWVLWENRINAPLSRETDEERSARIRKLGQPTTCRIVFRAEERWTPERVAKARAANAALEDRKSVV